MSKTFIPKVVFGGALFLLGYLFGGLGPFQRVSDAARENPPKGERISKHRVEDFSTSRALGNSKSEILRQELVNYWEQADMAAVVGKMDSIKTFEDNTFDTGLSQDLCDYLAISKEEAANLNRAIRSSVAQVQEIQKAAIEVTQVDATTRKFIIREFPSEGGAIMESLQARIQETLGDNRSFLFRKISSNSLSSSLLTCGDSEVQITIKQTGNPGAQRYETMILSGDGSRRFETDRMPDELFPILNAE